MASVFLQGGETLQVRAKRFILAFQALDGDADVVVYAGTSVGDESPQAAVLIEMDSEPFGFTTEQARLVALVVEKMMGDHTGSNGCLYAGFPTLIRVLRQGADASDESFRTGRHLQ